MKTETIQKLHPRAWEIYQMKQSGKSTEDVARHYQIRRDLVRQRCKLIRESLEKPDEWWDGLSTRSVNLCKELNLQSKADLLAVYESGKILETLNYGRKTHREIADFLGIEPTEYLQVLRKTRKAFERWTNEKRDL